MTAVTEADRAPTVVGRSIPRTLRHSLLGRRPRRTVAAVAYLGVVASLFATRYAGRVLPLHGAPLETHTVAFDALSALLIAVVAVTILVVPVGYAIWDGGPLLSVAIPLVPVAAPEILAGRYVLELDWMIALTVGAAAATVAQYGTDVRTAGTWRPWRSNAIDEDGLLVVTACAVGTAVIAWRFVDAAPAGVTRQYRPFATLFAVPAAVVGRYWSAWIRDGDRGTTVRDEPSPD